MTDQVDTQNPTSDRSANRNGLVTVVKLFNPRYRELSTSITETENQLNQAVNERAEAVSKELYYTQRIAAVRNIENILRQNMTAISSDPEVSGWFVARNTNEIATLTSYLSECQTRTTRIDGTLADIRQRLAQMKEQLLRLGTPEATIQLVAVRQALANFPEINRRQIILRQPASEDPYVYLRFVMRNLCYTPTSLDDLSDVITPLTTPEEMKIPLPTMSIQIRLNDGQLQIKQLDAFPRYYFWSGAARAHPHILNHNSPCLGDFAGQFREFVADQDWQGVVSILKMFFRIAVTSDGAGRSWREFFTQRHMRRYECHSGNSLREGTYLTRDTDTVRLYYKVIEFEPAKYKYEAYLASGDRIPEHDMEHPANEFVGALV